MTKRTFNVLSIDWDYFINATADQRYELFPDGGNENIAPFVAQIIWSTRYGTPELGDISIDRAEYDKMMKVLDSSVAGVGVIVDSHKHAYDMIQRFNLDELPINLINVDFHHDCYGDSVEKPVDCGNWVTQLFEGGANTLAKPGSKYTWVSRQDSDTADYDNPGYEWAERVVGLDAVEWLDDFDLIFLCRSSVWSPPHLDEGFIEMAEAVEGAAGWQTVTQEGIHDSRYGEELRANVEEYKRAMEACKAHA